MRFQQAVLLFSNLQYQITEWEQTLSREDAKKQLRGLLLKLSPADFEMLECLVLMFMTEPGKRLLGGELNMAPLLEFIDTVKQDRMYQTSGLVC